jgi:copper chaperone CopZ
MKKTFHVPDMECPNCAMHLQNLEDDLFGVRRIDASYKKMSMEVEYDETKLSIEQIIQAANAIGYHPELKTA